MKYEHQRKFLIMNKIESKTGLVKKMRQIREKLSSEILDMSFEQEKLFLQNQLKKLKAS